MTTAHAEPRRTSPISLIGFGTFLLIGWNALLVPSLIRSIEHDFQQTDAGVGVYYLISSILYASGSFFGGLLIERLGRRLVISGCALILGAGAAGMSMATDWPLFVAAGLPAAFGAGNLDGGVNGLFLALYSRGRSGALNLLHLFFALGALIAPLVIGQLVEAGAQWRTLVLSTGVVAVVVCVLLASQQMPSGRRHRSSTDLAHALETVRRSRIPFVALAAAICFYVASEIGVSSWLVRFLADAPLSVATLALSLFWGGLTLGRLVSAGIADRFTAVPFAIACSIFAAVALIAAVLSPSVPLTVALFAIGGFGLGPVYPMIMAIAGTLYPDRLAAVSGGLGASAIAGSVIYPPLMGFMSAELGLGVGMLGTGLLGFACAAALLGAATASRHAASTAVASNPRSG